MIKINLLLARKEKKKSGMRKEFIVLILSVVLLLGVLGLYPMEIGTGKREDTLAQISKTKGRDRLLQISDHGSRKKQRRAEDVAK